MHIFLKYKDLPSLFQNIGIAILTFFIPFALVIFTDIHQKKDRNDPFSLLDFNVMLDSVINVKKLLLSIFLIFIPFIFWSLANDSGKTIIITFWLFGMGIFLQSFSDFYIWIKGQVFKYRYDYLKKLNDKPSQEIVWRSVWETKNINAIDEKTFFLIYSDKINSLFKSGNNTNKLQLIFKLLADFNTFVGNRTIIFISVYEEVLPQILKWHFKAWEQERMLLKKESNRDLNLWSLYSEIGRTITEILKTIEKTVLLDKAKFSHYDLYKYFNIHIKMNKNNEYLQEFFNIFYQVYFDVIINNKDYDIDWESFPDEWLVTIERVKKKEMPPFYSLNEYLQLFFNRINNDGSEPDFRLDNITLNLFPDIDPIIWSRILFLIYSGYEPKNKIKSLINRSWNVGVIGRIKVYSANSKSDLEKEFIKTNKQWKDNALQLAVYLFKNRLPKKDIEKYIQETKKIKYKEDSLEESKRKNLLDIFKAINNLI